MQSIGKVVFSSRDIKCPDGIFETCGFKWLSISLEIFSVGPPHPLTMGRTAMGFLCIFLRKYICWVLGGVFVLKDRYSFVSESMIPSL